MKKIIFGGIAIVAIAGAIAFSVTMKTTDYGLSDLSLSNVEALATKPPPMDCYVYCPFLTPGLICHMYGSVTGYIDSCPSMSNTWY